MLTLFIIISILLFIIGISLCIAKLSSGDELGNDIFCATMIVLSILFGLFLFLSIREANKIKEKEKAYKVENFEKSPNMVKKILMLSRENKVLNEDDVKYLKIKEINIIRDVSKENDSLMIIELNNMPNDICQNYVEFFSKDISNVNEIIVNNFLFKPMNIEENEELNILTAPLPANISKVCVMEKNKIRLVKYMKN